MSVTAGPVASVDAYDVYISCQRADVVWAERLAKDLEWGGLRCFLDDVTSPGVSRTESLNETLESCRVLVVLWSREAVLSERVITVLARFEELLSQGHERRRIFPFPLGGAEVVSRGEKIEVKTYRPTTAETANSIAAMIDNPRLRFRADFSICSSSFRSSDRTSARKV